VGYLSEEAVGFAQGRFSSTGVRSCFYFSYDTGFHVQGDWALRQFLSFKKPKQNRELETLAPISLTARVPDPQSRVTKQSCHWGVKP
jgi:hypothetical protein